ncbi:MULTISPECIES: acetolactate decarboxylase [unclassified Corynebacterium]|uniref:acetolactate decarboxylase n=1 Tax=unclassified Corynebacterium TaxID=2624378 RepID=UPI002A915AC4|nr:acetolactate decarboxylase [Corynebacterium sp.]MDY5785852.1 acetolactate decarboxylase [Corynebacterium sp.]
MIPTRHTIFQHGLISSLASGVFDDDLTLQELLGHGSFGIGTFNELDGEMIIIGGRCYQMRADGTITEPPLSTKTPYAVVTNFVPSLSMELSGDLVRKSVSEIIDTMEPSSNYLYAVRITGEFNWVTTRTVARQTRPYPSLVDATDGEDVLRFDNVTGVLCGFRTPEFEATISVPGCHVHFIDDDHTVGGHVIDYEIKSAVAELCIGTDLQLRLPLSKEFMDANLTPDDLMEQLGKAEHSDL